MGQQTAASPMLEGMAYSYFSLPVFGCCMNKLWQPSSSQGSTDDANLEFGLFQLADVLKELQILGRNASDSLLVT